LNLTYDEALLNVAVNYKLRRYTKVAVALLDGGANIDFTTPRRHECPGFTPLMFAAEMFAAEANHAGVAKLLLERGADGTKTTSQACAGIAAGSTALDIARQRAGRNRDFAKTLVGRC